VKGRKFSLTLDVAAQFCILGVIKEKKERGKRGTRIKIETVLPICILYPYKRRREGSFLWGGAGGKRARNELFSDSCLLPLYKERGDRNKKGGGGKRKKGEGERDEESRSSFLYFSVRGGAEEKEGGEKEE